MNFQELLKKLLDTGIVVGSERAGYKINPYIEMPKSLGFEEVGILQNNSLLENNSYVASRSDVDTTSEVIRGVYLQAPFMAANMSSVCNGAFALKLRQLGAMGVIHRAWRRELDYLDEVHNLIIYSDSPWVAASVGVGEDQFELAKKLIGVGANILFIDIAHGYSEAVLHLARQIKKYSSETKVVVGNTNNVDMLYDFNDVADAVKAGIAQGLSCETALTAGATERMYTTVDKFKKASADLGLPIISDGGIRSPSDATKAIAAGANSVMMGSVFARCAESAAELIYVNDKPKKKYTGMASRENQEKWHGYVKNDCPEGKTILLDLGEPVEALLKRYVGALRSGITYAGAKNIKEFQEKVKFTRI